MKMNNMNCIRNRGIAKIVACVSFICLFLLPINLLSKEPSIRYSDVDLSVGEIQLPRVLPRLRKVPSSLRKIPKGLPKGLPKGSKGPFERTSNPNLLKGMGDDVIRQMLKDSSGVSFNNTGRYEIVRPIEFYNIDMHYSPYLNSYKPFELHTNPGIFIPKYINMGTYNSSGMFSIKEVDISPYGNRQTQFQIDSTILNMNSTSEALGIDLDLFEWDHSE